MRDVCRHVRSRFVTSFDCLTFLTDYGLEDGFVAACHGVAVRIAPAARIIDITHLVQPGDVRRGAAVLAQTVPYLPPAVHVAVVDPGVGTARRAVAVQAGGCCEVRLSIPAAQFGALGVGFGSPLIVRCGRPQLTIPSLETFAAVAPGEIVAFTDSAGLISLAV